MRHRIAGNKLGRNSSLRKATVRDIAKATLVHQRICTTKAKAKEARKLVDRLITMGKKGTLAHRRRAFAILCDHRLVSDLFNETAPRFKERSGGYTRMIPLSMRRGDNAQLTYLELTEKSAAFISKPKSAASAKTKDADVPQAAVAADKADKTEKKPAARKPRTTAKKSDQTKADPAKKKIVGGIKKMFNRKSPEQ